VRLADNGASHFLLKSLITIGCGVWLWVFLTPMEHLGLLVDAHSFLPLFVILVVAQWIPLPVVRVLAGIAVSIGYVLHYYGSTALGTFAQVRDLFVQEWGQMQGLLHGGSLSDPLQTQLFLFVICIMYWLIVYASRRTRLWVFYNVLAVVVLGIVDGNTPVHPNGAIVAVLFICVLVLGVSHFARLQTHIANPDRGPVRFFAPLTGLVVVTMVAGWIVPKQAAVWPNPAKLWNAVAGGDGSGSGKAVQMIGYQSDNERLGGSFVMNHNPVLSVVTKYPAYLRGEVFATYTGKGWTPGYSQSQSFQPDESFSGYAGLLNHVKTQAVTQQVQVLSNQMSANVTFAAYEADKVARNKALAGVYQVVQGTGVVYGPMLHKDDGYSVQSVELVDPISYLESLPGPTSEQSVQYAPDVQVDLELPPILPSRIHDLAVQITQGAKNEFDMAQKIQDYLQANYQYNTQNVPVPGNNQDYVDQFLFDSKMGYCNNFSSSMAVMLRTLGIPTRWVTGFDTGTEDPSYTGSETKYIIENSDAHSWVEVYFPNVGWIPFDPTPNFSMTFLPAQTSPATGGTTSPDNSTGSAARKPHIQPGADSSSNASSWQWSAVLGVIERILGIAVLCLLLLGFIFRQRIKETRHRWVWKNTTAHGMVKAIQHLLRVLRRNGEIPDRENTLRDLHPVAKSYGIRDDEYLHLLRTAESTWYGGVKPKEEDVERVRGTWLKWILGVLRR
jgi:transglutaminase-like putative cysteine protease